MTTGRATDDTNPSSGEGARRAPREAAAGPLAARVRALAVYPAKDEPGQELTEAAVETEGLRGDRRKKMPVHLVGAEETPASTRANLFLDVPDAQVRAAVGARVQVGEIVLVLAQLPSGCPGVYAVVEVAGVVRVGDIVGPPDSQL